MRHVAAIFFPQVKTLGIDVDGSYSPSVLRKVVQAGTKDTSYKSASETLAEQAEIQVSAKQCERIVQRIGRERLDETAQSVAQWEALPLPKRREYPASAPQNSWEARVAVVEFDGGRVQLRDETCLLYTSPSPRDGLLSRMPSSA